MTLLDWTPINTLRKGSTPVLETERLVLRAPRFEDAKQVSALLNDRRVTENTARIAHPYGIADANEWIGWVSAHSAESYLITFHNDIVGGCAIDIDMRKGGLEIGFWLGVPFWGCGYATEAVRGLIDHAFADLGYEALMAGARISNPASRRVLEKCGFQWTGVGLYRIPAINSSAPFDRFRLERSIWASLKSWGAPRRVVSVAPRYRESKP